MSKEEFYGSVGAHTSGDQVPAEASEETAAPEERVEVLRDPSSFATRRHMLEYIAQGGKVEGYESKKPKVTTDLGTVDVPKPIVITKSSSGTRTRPGLRTEIQGLQEVRDAGGTKQTYQTNTLKNIADTHLAAVKNWFDTNRESIITSGDEKAKDHMIKGSLGLHQALASMEAAKANYGARKNGQGNGHLVSAVKGLAQAVRHFSDGSVVNSSKLGLGPAAESTVIDRTTKSPVTLNINDLRKHTEGELDVPKPEGKTPRTFRGFDGLMDHTDPYTALALHRILKAHSAGDRRFAFLDPIMDKLKPQATPKGGPAYGPGEGPNRGVTEAAFPRGTAAGLPGQAVMAGTQPAIPGVGVQQRLADEDAAAKKAGKRAVPNVKKPTDDGAVKPEVQQSVRDMNELLEKSGETNRVEESPEVTAEQNRKLKGKRADQRTEAVKLADEAASKAAAEKANKEKEKGVDKAKVEAVSASIAAATAKDKPKE